MDMDLGMEIDKGTYEATGYSPLGNKSQALFIVIEGSNGHHK